MNILIMNKYILVLLITIITPLALLSQNINTGQRLNITRDSIQLNCYCDTIADRYSIIGYKKLLREIKKSGDRNNISSLIQAYQHWTASIKNEITFKGVCRGWVHKKYEKISDLFNAAKSSISYLSDLVYKSEEKADFETMFYWLITQPNTLNIMVKHYNENKN